MSDSAATVDLLEAVKRGASYRLEGSEDWDTKPGRLTVWLDLNSDEWDAVYDGLDEIDAGDFDLRRADRVG